MLSLWHAHQTWGRSLPTNRDTPGIVFIIHGRDINFAEAVAHFVEKHDLKAVILHEQPNQGRTIIEKFEQHEMNCDYAIALFTPDDEGHLRNTGEPLQSCARQNVILETGYFSGKLGRDRVAVLYSKNVELPSDLAGLAYISVDSATWKENLKREFVAAGIIADTQLT